MNADWIARVLLRDLDSLSDQLNAYTDEAEIWQPLPGIANSAGTLALHIAGNIQHFIGAQLGETGYVRDREAEFGTRDLSRGELLEQVEAARTAVETGFSQLGTGALDSSYPIELAGTRAATGQFLVHLVAHLAYHLGQLDYHRRCVTGSGAVNGMQSIPTLVAADGPNS